MISFEQVMAFTSKVSSHTAFEDEECRLFYDTLVQLPDKSTVVEIGVEYGRSTSIILQVAKALAHRVILIDPFVGAEGGSSFMHMSDKIGHPFILFKMTTHQYVYQGLSFPSCNFIHIDGSHTTDELTFDCEWMLPKVEQGGYACFHDYGRHSLPEVYPVVNQFVRNDKWEEAAHKGTLLVMRRLRDQ